MSDSEWKNILPKLSYNVLRKSYTEPAFSSRLNFNKKSGYYACRDVKTHFTTQKTNMTLVLDGLPSTEKLEITLNMMWIIKLDIQEPS